MLFHVQDSDRPLYIVASDYQDAIKQWQGIILAENPEHEDKDHPSLPEGVQLVCDDNDLVVGGQLVEQLAAELSPAFPLEHPALNSEQDPLRIVNEEEEIGALCRAAADAIDSNDVMSALGAVKPFFDRWEDFDWLKGDLRAGEEKRLKREIRLLLLGMYREGQERERKAAEQIAKQ